MQSIGAGQFGEVALNAVVEAVADGRVRMGEESVAAGAVVVALWRLQLGTISAIHIEGLVALVDLPYQGVEDQAVGTQLLCGLSIDALVEFITLDGILVLSIPGICRALEPLLGICG